MNNEQKVSAMKIEIKLRFTIACLWTREVDEYGSAPKNLGAAVKAALASGADLSGKKIQALRAFSGLYQYQIWAYVLEDGTACVRMGCLYKTVPEWDAVTIRESNTSEFPNDGSPRCEQRARAFEYAHGEALVMAAECAAAKAEATP